MYTIRCCQSTSTIARYSPTRILKACTELRRVRYRTGSSATVRTFGAILCRTALSSFRNSSAASSENSTRNASRSFLFDQAFYRDRFSRANLAARLEDILDRLHAHAVFQGAGDRIPNEFGLRWEALFLGCGRKKLRLLSREFEAERLHEIVIPWYYLTIMMGMVNLNYNTSGPSVTNSPENGAGRTSSPLEGGGSVLTPPVTDSSRNQDSARRSTRRLAIGRSPRS